MPKPVLTLAVAWAEFEAMVFDDGVSRAAKTQARKVFYSGAQSVLDILMAGLEPESKVTDCDIQRVAALRAELREVWRRRRGGPGVSEVAIDPHQNPAASPASLMPSLRPRVFALAASMLRG